MISNQTLRRSKELVKQSNVDNTVIIPKTILNEPSLNNITTREPENVIYNDNEYKTSYQKYKADKEKEQQENVISIAENGVIKTNNNIENEQFSGTSSEALAKARKSEKTLILGSFGDTSNEISNSFSKTKEMFSSSLKDKFGVSSVSDIQKELEKNLNEEAMLKLETKVLSNHMVESSILQMIATQVDSKYDEIKSMTQDANMFYLTQKAYIASYLNATFGSPDYIGKIQKTAAKSVGDFISNLASKQIDAAGNFINTKSDKIFNRVLDTVGTTTTKITNRIDKISQINIVKRLNNMLENKISFQSLQAKLNSTPVGRFLSPIISPVLKEVSNVAKKLIANTKIVKQIKEVQERFMFVQKKLAEAKKFVADKIKMIKNYVNELKNKAIEAVKGYAQQIVNDIKSKIAIWGAEAISGGLSV